MPAGRGSALRAVGHRFNAVFISRPLRSAQSIHGEAPLVRDIGFIVITVIFFLLSWLYVRACERV